MTYGKINYNEYDAIIFDIDGVLIDVGSSYNQTIIKTVQYVLKNNFDIELTEFPYEELITKFRYTGGFNDDIDTTYSIILIFLYYSNFHKIRGEQIVVFFNELLKKIDDKGVESVEKELEKIGDIQSIKSKLKYNNKDDIISTIFNEIFYGPELFKKQFNRTPKYYFNEPFITNDILLIEESTIQYLSDLFKGNLVLVSGRSKVASYFTLDGLIDYFVKDACIFLEDEKKEFSKPNPFSLHKVFDCLELKNAIYVGDSIEDLLMVNNFRKVTNNREILFCGVYGKNNKASKDLKKLFKLKNADMIIEDVNDIPNILNNTKK